MFFPESVSFKQFSAPKLDNTPFPYQSAKDSIFLVKVLNICFHHWSFKLKQFLIYQTSILGTSRAKRWPRRHRTTRTGRTFSFSFYYLHTNYHMPYIFSVMKIKYRITHYLLFIFYKYWSATKNISSQALSYSMVICLSLFFLSNEQGLRGPRGSQGLRGPKGEVVSFLFLML